MIDFELSSQSFSPKTDVKTDILTRFPNSRTNRNSYEQEMSCLVEFSDAKMELTAAETIRLNNNNAEEDSIIESRLLEFESVNFHDEESVSTTYQDNFQKNNSENLSRVSAELSNKVATQSETGMDLPNKDSRLLCCLEKLGSSDDDCSIDNENRAGRDICDDTVDNLCLDGYSPEIGAKNEEDNYSDDVSSDNSNDLYIACDENEGKERAESVAGAADIVGEKSISSPVTASSSFYHFKLNPNCIIQDKRRKSFSCDICSVNYRHMFGLKRHYIRTHINPKYISKQDHVHCSVNTSEVDKELSIEKLSNEEGMGVKSENGNDLDNGKPVEIEIFINIQSEGKDAENNTKKLVVNLNPMPGLYRCNFCPLVFDQGEDLGLHLSEYHPKLQNVDGNFICHHCKLTFTMKRYLIRHMVVHDGRKVKKKTVTSLASTATSQCPDTTSDLSCSQCDVKFTLYTDLKVHIETHDRDVFMEADRAKSFSLGDPATINSRYGCTVCKKLFPHYINMCRHRRLAHHVSQRMNGRVKSFNSPICNLKTKVSSRVNQAKEDKPVDNFDPNFYAKVSKTINENLNHFLDGKADHIDIRQPSNDNFVSSLTDVQLVDNSISQEGSPSKAAIPLEVKKEVDEISSYQKLIETAQELLSQSKKNNLNTSTDNSLELYGNEELLTFFRKSLEESIFVCHSCDETFSNLAELDEHKLDDHPTVLSTHIELIGSKECPSEFIYRYSDPIGLLNESDTVAEDSKKLDELECSKCESHFESVTDLHSHILDCGTDKSLQSNVNRVRKRIRFVRSKGMKRQVRERSPYALSKRIHMDLEASQQPKEEPSKALPLKVADETLLLSDVIQVTTNQELRCEGCYMKFDYIAALERHQRACAMARRLNGIKSSARGLYSRCNPTSTKRQCQFCLQTFSYLASLRKHMEEGCQQQDITELQKKAIKKEKWLQKKKQAIAANPSTLPEKESAYPIAVSKESTAITHKNHICTHCAKIFVSTEDYETHLISECIPPQNFSSTVDTGAAEEVQISITGLKNMQSEQTKMFGETFNSNDQQSPKPKLQTFSCNICHMIYFSYIKLLRHRLSHKLEKSELEETTIEIDKELKSEVTPKNEAKVGDKVVNVAPAVVYKKEDCTCPTCDRIFASPLNMGRHNRMAHGMIRAALNQRRIILSTQTKEEKAASTPFRVSISKVGGDGGQEETRFWVHPMEPKKDAPQKGKAKNNDPKPTNASADQSIDNASFKKRGWPKGRRRKIAPKVTPETTDLPAQLPEVSSVKSD